MMPSIIILHGWSLDPTQKQKWQVFRDALTQKNISSRMLAIPGLSAPLNEVWNLDNYVSWLGKELANEKEVVLLGHSFGGQVAVRYAAQHHQQVKKLILIDSSGIRDHSPKATLKRNGFMVMAKIGKLFFQNEAFRKLLYYLARERDYQNAPPLLRRTMSQILDDEVVDDLSKVEAPTLILWGEKDLVTPAFLAKTFQQKIPDSELQFIAGARHSPQYTHPAEVADMIEKFIGN